VLRESVQRAGLTSRIESDNKMAEKTKATVIDVLRKLVYLVAVVCCVVLAVTGFYPVLFLGEHLSGYPMMVHATFAPVFAACVAALSVMWAGRCRFEHGDCPVVKRLIEWATGEKAEAGEGTCCRAGVLQKVFFWLLVVLALPLILSIVVSMFPLFGPGRQEFLLGVHRCVGGLFVVAAVVHGFLLFSGRAKPSK